MTRLGILNPMNLSRFGEMTQREGCSFVFVQLALATAVPFEHLSSSIVSCTERKNFLTGFQNASLDLVGFDRFKQSLEVTFPKTIVAFSLNEFKEYWTDNGL